MTNGYKDSLLLDVDNQEDDEATCELGGPDEIGEIIEETKKQIQAIFEGSEAADTKQEVSA